MTGMSETRTQRQVKDEWIFPRTVTIKLERSQPYLQRRWRRSAPTTSRSRVDLTTIHAEESSMIVN
ncbi:hypothetical protein AALP_AAs39512U000100 [Arabis alpina]|uniref:Uncharacterized protein n=1 Tax=Arabis alpina TaxID=50452 RepID=A0A087G1W5_ARAAL|nr:hypothetical protein AALP_AAs39512U000100 [Arabis alpina]